VGFVGKYINGFLYALIACIFRCTWTFFTCGFSFHLFYCTLMKKCWLLFFKVVFCFFLRLSSLQRGIYFLVKRSHMITTLTTRMKERFHVTAIQKIAGAI